MTHSDAYKQRINSAEWQMLRERLIALAGNECERCGEPGPGLQLHHKTYERLGYEHPDDLEVLCLDCHEEADREREVETAERIWIARVEGWAAKKYGENWDELDFEALEDEFQEWLEGGDW